MSFTIESYKSLLQAGISNGFSFLAFDDPKKSETEPVCLLRHDIDVDLGAAVKLAEIEADLGVQATYFLMLRSPVYNLLSRANHQMVERLIELGHWIGLHYDEGFSPKGLISLEEGVKKEARILSSMFDVPIGTVSFHQPSSRVLNEDIEIPGMVNTYRRRDLQGFHYCSDSNKQWRQAPAEIFLREKRCPKFHLLIHPMWWNHIDESLSTKEIWNISLRANWKRCQDQLLATELAYGGPRTFHLVD